MSELNQPLEEQARQIIRDWLTAHTRSLRNLAREAGLQPSVLSRFLKGETTLEAGSAVKLYSVLQHTLSAIERKTFIVATGLLPLALAFSNDTMLMTDKHASPYEIGSRLMLAGLTQYDHKVYAEAIALFRTAEEIFGAGSSQAALAGCMIAQIFINLGDLHQAQTEAERVQQTYGAVMDPNTKAELYRIHTWVAYYQGNYGPAAQWDRARIKLGEEAGIERFQHPHFLGRIYYDLGCLGQSALPNAQLFQRAVDCFAQANQIDQRWGNETNQAFEHFRTAQVLHKQGDWQAARSLRAKARQIFNNGSFGGSIALLNIEVEEAKILLENDEFKRAKRKAEMALHGWAQAKYAKGIGDSLTILGELEYTQGNEARALEIFTAKLCIYPYDNHPSNRQIWEDIYYLEQEIIRREGRKFYQQLIQRIYRLAQHRQGYFTYLNRIITDRSLEIERIFGQLQSFLP